MTILDIAVFIGLLILTDKERRPSVCIGMLLVTAAFALLRYIL